jgi:hypothetical protein
MTKHERKEGKTKTRKMTERLAKEQKGKHQRRTE